VILSRQQANAIATGRKTTHHTLHDTLRAGARIPITVRDKPREPEIVCYTEITHTEHRTLRDLTRTEAKREGFDGPRGPLTFRKAWLEQHDKVWALQQARTDHGLTDEIIAERFKRYHEGRIPVNVITFRLAEAPDRWMARSSGRLTKGQTTSSPRDAIDELPVPPQEFVDALAKQANVTRITDRTAARKAAAIERLAFALCRSHGKQANNTLRAIERMTASLDRETA
jgi:hypothetical protein